MSILMPANVAVNSWVVDDTFKVTFLIPVNKEMLVNIGRENSSTIEAWQEDAGIIKSAECKHCHQNTKELHEYDGLVGLWCEDCADIHINNEVEYLSTCCGASRNEYIVDMCNSCHEIADFECTGCGM